MENRYTGMFQRLRSKIVLYSEVRKEIRDWRFEQKGPDI